MKQGFRQSQAWLHTWSGVVLGWLLFAIFITGTVSYFQDEITHWMHPERHLADARSVDLDALTAALTERAPNAPSWQIGLPSARDPVITTYWRGEGARRFEHAVFDPATGRELVERPSEGGNFFYRFHFQLWHMDVLTARYLIGIATMFMFVALISGIITHKKIFKDFFTFRPSKGQRSWLDGHNATAVLALPFHLMITFTGLVIFLWMYMPWGMVAQYGDDRMAFFAQVFPRLEAPPRADTPMPVPSLQAFVDKAQVRWGGEPVESITVHNPGDRNARIELGTGRDSRVSGDAPHLIYDAANGELLEEYGELRPVAFFSRVLVGLHLGHFADPLLRWLYFLSGIGGTIMVASGLVLWVVKRTAQAGEKPGYGLRLVRVLNVGAVAGLVIAMASFLWANRLIPGALPNRDEWEIHVFFAAWGAALLHSIFRTHRQAWVEQFALAALLLTAIPLLDLATGNFHLPTGGRYSDWILTGFQLTSVATGAALFWLSWKIAKHQPRQRPERAARPQKLPPQDDEHRLDLEPSP
ncbi:PepSY-associated TM helix domain-containing protein [Pseudomonas matsuisoli]|uniref:Membrane protein n=1 Tax=Pseudomonas matsuisoli TaxID=1515666 RepID=A0A917PTM5_9PSED|nr:PepSY-associated TM helix domain-containing protein [Pseudomonas matsuisoli]GGJ91083.1 membrane protein [Pseudomonas matsuisoli]